MFGRSTARFFDELPNLEGLDSATAKRRLSAAYLDVLAARTESVRNSGPEQAAVADYLRRLVGTLESHAIFDAPAASEVRQGAAFIAAEALAILSDLPVSLNPTGDKNDSDAAEDRKTILVEAGLLYLIGGFESNAATILSRDSDFGQTSRSGEGPFADWAMVILRGLCRLDMSVIELERPGDPQKLITENLSRGVHAILFDTIATATQEYLRWLSGRSSTGLETARAKLAGVVQSIARRTAVEHSRAHHLARLVQAAIAATEKRAVRNVPPPSTAVDVYTLYLLRRSRGSTRSLPRPVLWPAALEYVEKCLPGPHSSAVVSIPTGAGKSFLAELAVSQGLCAGWVIYLVPTNSLAAQVRRDLSIALEGLAGAQVKAFLGGDEYTTLEGETVTNVPSGTVVVMTPEKCALALRLAPEAFTTCRVCIFDECHLISDGTRGVLAELVVGHIAALSPSCRFLLMSAMMKNPEELSKWLTVATQYKCEEIRSQWRPTRTLRGVVGFERDAVLVSGRSAANALIATRPTRTGKIRKRKSFESTHVILAGLQGEWSDTIEENYAIVKLPTRSELAVMRENEGDLPSLDGSGSVNSISAALATFFAGHRMPVLVFLPANKHHCFSVADRVTVPVAFLQERKLSPFASALIELSRYELGAPSEVGELLERGVAVHTSALIEAEKQVAEHCFQDGSAIAMLATGTLAQGLNLPAAVVVIGGTVVGDRREAQKPEAIARARSQLLNALGRAGRARVANQGIALVVPDSPLLFGTRPDPSRGLQAAHFLADEDDSTDIESRLGAFIDSAVNSRLDVNGGSPEELVALSYLPMTSIRGVTAEKILEHTLALSSLPAETRPLVASRAASELIRVGSKYVTESAAPEWISVVAYKTGLPYLTCLQASDALGKISLPSTRPSSIVDWRAILFSVLSTLPPNSAREILGKEIKSSTISNLWAQNTTTNDPLWIPSPSWTESWKALDSIVMQFMSGEKISEIARRLFSLPPLPSPIDSGRSDGSKPIPRTIEFLSVLVERLSRIAGLIVAIDEASPFFASRWGQTKPQVDFLPLLPLAVRFGCDTRDSLAWYRFGIRFRRPAHLLASLFPVPPSVNADADVRRWISNILTNLTTNSSVPLNRADEADIAALNAVRVIAASG